MDLKWLHDGTAVLVVSNGSGEPLTEKGDANADYVPSVVARLTTEQVEPAQLSDTDPLAEPADTTYPGQLAGYPAPPPQSPAVVGPAKVTTSTATEDPGPQTAPGDLAGLQAENARLQAELDAARRDLAGGADVPERAQFGSTTTGPGPEARAAGV